MPVTYKDFDKEAKDLLSKKYQGGAWKIECKAKGPKEQLYINPIAEKGVISADLQWDCATTKSKLTIDQNGNVKDKVTYTQGTNVFEVTGGTKIGSQDCCKNWEVEATHELKADQFNLKTGATYVTGKELENSVGFVYDVTPNIAVGAGLGLYAFQLKSWSAGLRYTNGGILATAQYFKTGAINVSAKYPLVVAGRKVSLATQVQSGDSLTYTVGAETQCLLCESATCRVKYSPSKGFGAAWIKKINDIWEAAVSVEQDKGGVKVGVLFTHE